MDFIAEKKHNFQKFLRDKLPASFDSYVNKLELTPVSLFVLYVRNELVKIEHDIDNYIDKLLKENGSKREDFKSEDMNRFKRYISMFIDICREQ